MNRPRQIALMSFSPCSRSPGATQRSFAQDDGAARALEGVWAMSITFRDCATPAPLGSAGPVAVDVPCRRNH